MTDESPARLGAPFIIMEYLENDADIIDAFNTQVFQMTTDRSWILRHRRKT